MPKVQLDSGQILEFENDPTPGDIDAAVAQLKSISPQKSIVASIPSNTELRAPKMPFKLNPMGTEEQAKAQNIGAISRISGQRISDVANQYEGKTPETGLKRTFPIGMQRDPTTKQLVQGITDIPIKASIGAGLATNPVGTGVGLALGYPVFKGLDFLTQKVQERLPEKTPESLKDLVGTAGYLGSLAVGGKILNKMQVPKSSVKLAQEATAEYRNILRPTQGEVKNIEIRQGKNMDDYYRLAAEEQLPIKQTPDKKLDTTLARQTLQPKIEEIHNALNEVLQGRQNKFDLMALATRAKLELSKNIKNAKELKDSQAQVDEYINSEVERYGSDKVSPLDFNNIKQGMWSVAYDMMKPTSKAVARKLGFVAKEMIESAYPNNKVRELNELSGKYQTLTNLLENAQGRVIQGGKLGRYFAKTIGAVAGSGIPVVGPIVGQHLGGKVSEYLAAPERASKVASKKAQQAGIVKKSYKNIMGVNNP